MAFLITINIMFGAGAFINIAQLAQISGPISILAYPIVGLMLLPLIFTFSKLLAFHPGATFYEIGSYINPFIGFLTTWGYFVGKLAAAALGVHVFTTSCSLFFPIISPYTLLINSTIISCFGLLTLFSLKTGLPMQILFLLLKMIPLLVGILSGLCLIQTPNFSTYMASWETLPATFPLVLFAFAGFEASCSLGKQIPDSKKNAPRIIFFSFLFTLALVTILQIIFVGALGAQLGRVADFREPFAILLDTIFGKNPTLASALFGATIAGIASSALGSSYSILSSNVWNMQTIASHNLIPGSKLFKKINSFHAPTWATIAAVFIEIGYLIGTNANIYTLQRISASANVLAYTVGTIAYLLITLKKKSNRITAFLASGTCTILLYSIFAEGMTSGFTPYKIYGFLLITGIILNFLSKKTERKDLLVAPSIAQ